MKKLIFSIFVVIAIVSCSSPEKKLEKKLMIPIKSYMEANKGKQDVIDSIVIMDIDTLTPATYLFLYQQSLLNKADALGLQLRDFPEDDKSEEYQYVVLQNIKTLNKIDSCNIALASPTLEKSVVWGHFVITKIYVKHPDNMPEVLDIGFPITIDNKVYEMDL